MRSRPILFSAPMVRALLAGTKTQTRRLIPVDKTDALTRLERELGKPTTTDEWGACFDNDGTGGVVSVPLPCKYGQRGDRLWIRETWSHDAPDLETCRAAYEDMSGGVGYGPYYRATEVAPDTLRWKPAIHMPRWASRIELEVADVRVERLNAITEEDARAEGVVSGRVPADDYGPERIGFVLGHDDGKCILHPTERRAFEVGWESINGERAPWSSHPWVWVVLFKRVKP